jgi:hypothetical protein
LVLRQCVLQCQHLYRRKVVQRDGAARRIQNWVRVVGAKIQARKVKNAVVTIERVWSYYRRWRLLCNWHKTICSLRMLFGQFRSDGKFPSLSDSIVKQLKSWVVRDALLRLQAHCLGYISRRRYELVKRYTLRTQYLYRMRRKRVAIPQQQQEMMAEEKLKQLAALRAQKELLMSKLKSSTPSASSKKTQVSAVDVVRLEAHECEKEEAPKPKQPDLAAMVLQNLKRLSPQELTRLTEMNTKLNRQHKRKLDFQIVQREGPKPPSPNAKTLAKFAEAARRDGLCGDIHQTSRIKWKPNDELITVLSGETSQSSPLSCAEKCKPILKRHKHVDAEEAMDECPLSPVTIQVFQYVEQERRLTMSAKSLIRRGRR